MEFDISHFLKTVQHPIKGRLFLLTKLPSAFFAGVRIKQCTKESCSVVIPFKWFSQNPFKSTYFACLAMAAEMSTGVLALANIYKRIPKVSMLVVKMEMEYYKKAIEETIFICEDGKLIAQAVQESIDTKESVEIITTSKGYNSKGELIAIGKFHWSFKSK